jgi:hypothetical protein
MLAGTTRRHGICTLGPTPPKIHDLLDPRRLRHMILTARRPLEISNAALHGPARSFRSLHMQAPTSEHWWRQWQRQRLFQRAWPTQRYLPRSTDPSCQKCWLGSHGPGHSGRPLWCQSRRRLKVAISSLAGSRRFGRLILPLERMKSRPRARGRSLRTSSCLRRGRPLRCRSWESDQRCCGCSCFGA